LASAKAIATETVTVLEPSAVFNGTVDKMCPGALVAQTREADLIFATIQHLMPASLRQHRLCRTPPRYQLLLQDLLFPLSLLQLLPLLLLAPVQL
jgi:hypothetical protein